MKKVSKNMELMYITRRNATLELIRSAIQTIQEDNRIVTKKELMGLTGISSGTLSKEYVKDLLKEKNVCQYRKTTMISNKEISDISLSRKLDEAIHDRKKLLSENQNLKMKVERQTNKINKLITDLNNLKIDYEIILGKHQQILEYLDSIGLDKSPYGIII